MQDTSTDYERRLNAELDAAKVIIETALTHLRLPSGRKRAIQILEDGVKQHGHSIQHRLARQ